MILLKDTMCTKPFMVYSSVTRCFVLFISAGVNAVNPACVDNSTETIRTLLGLKLVRKLRKTRISGKEDMCNIPALAASLKSEVRDVKRGGKYHLMHLEEKSW